MTVSEIVPRRWLKQADLLLPVLMFAIIGVGLTALASIAANGAPAYLKRQLIWLAVGLGAFVLGAWVDCERVSRASRLLYLVNVGLLIAVLVFGHEGKGSVRWFGTETFRFQPSELAKLLTIITLAAYFTKRIENLGRFSVFALSVAHVGLPVLLIMKQPDLGTSLSLVAIWLGMAAVAGMPWQRLVTFLMAGLALFAVAWQYEIIHDYQKQRILAVLHPDRDPAGAGYQLRQSRIAIGSGQVTGRGFGRGSQAHRRFIPERQTDFIFTVPAEEGGFVVSVLIVGAYTLLLLRGWTIAATTADTHSRLVAAGIISMLAFHVYVNLGMTLGLLPVTGVPLPFMSYGGTSLVISMASVGLLVGISGRREALVF